MGVMTQFVPFSLQGFSLTPLPLGAQGGFADSQPAPCQFDMALPSNTSQSQMSDLRAAFLAGSLFSMVGDSIDQAGQNIAREKLPNRSHGPAELLLDSNRNIAQSNATRSSHKPEILMAAGKRSLDPDSPEGFYSRLTGLINDTFDENVASLRRNPKLYDVLIKLIGSRSMFGEERARTLLLHMGEASVEPLIAALDIKYHKMTQEIHCAAIRLLGEIGDERAIVPIKGIILDRIDHARNFYQYRYCALEVVESAKETLLKFGKKAAPALMDLVQRSKRSDIRFWAAEKLIEYSDESLVEPLIEILKNDLDPSVRGCAAESLGKLRDLRAFEPLCKAMQSSVVPLRQIAAGALGDLGDERAIGLLSQFLGDNDKNMRDEAIEALKKFGPKSADALVDASLNHSDLSFAGEIAKTAFSINSQLASERWTKACADDDPQIQSRAIKHVEEHCYKFAQSYCIKQLKDTADAAKRIEALNVLGRIAGPDVDVLEALTPLLEHGEDGVKEAAADCLDEILRSIISSPTLIWILLSNPKTHVICEAIKKEIDHRFREELHQTVREIAKTFDSERLERVRSFLSPELMGKVDEYIAREKEAATPTHTKMKHVRQLDRDRKKEMRGKENAKYRQRFRSIVKDMVVRLTKALGVNSIATDTPKEHSDYGSVDMGSSSRGASMGIRQELKQTLQMQLAQKLMRMPELTIEAGLGAAEILERARILNFLVHHEAAHLVQKNRKIPRPKIDVSLYSHLNKKHVGHYANETLVDRIALEIARKFYVHGDGDFVFDEGLREAACIHANVALSRIALRKHKDGTRTLEAECLARFAAVLTEMGKSNTIGKTLKKEIKTLAEEVMAAAKQGLNKQASKEVKKLAEKYAQIFQKADVLKLK